jgi:alkylation response protein AidB-like acyl-CoA dehydrogenase
VQVVVHLGRIFGFGGAASGVSRADGGNHQLGEFRVGLRVAQFAHPLRRGQCVLLASASACRCNAAMKVTTDAVQVLGGYGYTRDYPAERYMREAKVTQIFEGTNQIQRLVIGRQLLK